eukprot:gb/GEZN01011195.1/.p1 GENE.gb/GEZN01011195.1/~~gb/GEZN01011195.1/.p1  ORF type:complete len:200 (-),score=68.69 gb/GEZN01011195.1/:355-954(-)
MSAEEPPKKKSKKSKKSKKAKDEGSVAENSSSSSSSPVASSSASSSVSPSSTTTPSEFMEKHQASYQSDEQGFAKIAAPMAGEKLTKKCLKLIKKGKEAKSVHRGVKEVVKALRNGKKGVVLLAANISPIDVLSHLPGLCEAKEVPYIWLPSKEDIGAAALTKRSSSVMLVMRGEAEDAPHNKTFDEVKEKIIQATPAW